MHGLIFETSVCYWQNQPGCYLYTTFRLCSKRSRQSLFFGIEILRKRTVLFYSDDFTNTDMIFNELAKIMINKQTLKSVSLHAFSILPSHIVHPQNTETLSCVKRRIVTSNVIQKTNTALKRNETNKISLHTTFHALSFL